MPGRTQSWWVLVVLRCTKKPLVDTLGLFQAAIQLRGGGVAEPGR